MPSYTLPPAGGSRPAAPSFGVGGAATAAEPFGGFPAPGRPASQYAAPEHAGTPAVPQQRREGTLYGTAAFSPIDMTMPVSTNPVENSGSLTGHILAQGWRDEFVDRRRNNLKVILAMLVVLGLMVALSTVFLMTTGSAFTDMVKGIFH